VPIPCATLARSSHVRRGECLRVGEGSTKFLVGTAVGATTGFAVGFFAATPTARSAGKSTLGSLGEGARFVGRTAIRAVDGLGLILESGYTRVRGREKYLEQEIEELREQITRLEQRVD
jgi:hypothetical protein